MKQPACVVTLREELPPGVQPIADMLGDAALLRLLEAHGGCRLSVPGRFGEFDPLARLIGIKPARRLVAAYGPGVIAIPLCKRWRAALLRGQGLSYAAIGRRLGMHEQSVYAMLTKRGAAARKFNPRQMSLPID